MLAHSPGLHLSRTPPPRRFWLRLSRALQKAGAHCLVIAPRKLDEQRTGVKTDARDAATLCQRLSRYVDGNTRELAVIRVPSEEEEQRRHVSVNLCCLRDTHG